MSGKRIVIQHASGLHQIIGHAPDGELPVTLENPGPIPFVSLVRVTSRMALYKAPIIPASYTFNEAQR
jgi:hypothetical protein